MQDSEPIAPTLSNDRYTSRSAWLISRCYYDLWTGAQIPSASFAVGLVDLLELGIDDTLVALRRGTGLGTRCCAAHCLADPHGYLRKTFGRLLEVLHVLALYGVLDRRGGLLDLSLHVRRDTTLRLYGQGRHKEIGRAHV